MEAGSAFSSFALLHSFFVSGMHALILWLLLGFDLPCGQFWGMNVGYRRMPLTCIVSDAICDRQESLYGIPNSLNLLCKPVVNIRG